MFVYAGEDTYESYKAAKLHLLKLSKTTNRETKVIDEEDIKSLNEFLYAIESVDIFGSSPILLAKRIFNNKDIATYFTENITKLRDVDLIVWQDKSIDTKTKLYKTLELHKIIKSFELPKPQEIKLWAKERGLKFGITFTDEVLNFILENAYTDKFVLDNEFQKLALIGIQKPSLEDVKEMFGLTVKGDVWKFIDYVGNRDKVKAIKEFEKLCAYEDTSQLVISLLQREFRIIAQIIMAKGNSAKLGSLGLAPFIVKKSQAKAKNFTIKEIRDFVGRLFNLDYAIKSGEIDDKIGLTLFLLTL